MGPHSGTAESSSAPSVSLLPANVLTVFLARFHVRKGNQIEYQYPPPPPASTNGNGKGKLVDVDDGGGLDESAFGVDLKDVEWKVLPSGGHLIEKDSIYFLPVQKSTVGVACYRNISLSDEQGAAEQRGARMVSVGLILKCDGQDTVYPSASAQQLATVPHLANLEKLADQLALAPSNTDPLKAYYKIHAFRAGPGEEALSAKQMKQLRMRRRRDPKNLLIDPISHMPALCGSLGAVLPRLLKKLMLPGHRLLIFSPTPPLVHAAHLGYNLADLVATAVGRSAKRSPNLRNFANGSVIYVKGQVGVHDIMALEEEEKLRRHSNACFSQSWIAWSTDKILLEKPYLFDSVLDLTPLISRSSKGLLDEAYLENPIEMARLLRVANTPSADANVRGKVVLKPERWTTREFATFNELDAQAQRHAERVDRVGDDACVSRRRVKRRSSKGTTRRGMSKDGDEGGLTVSSMRKRASRLEDQGPDEERTEYVHEHSNALTQWQGGCARAPRRGRAGTMNAILAFLRYWLAGWWFLPRHWRYGLPVAYVLPLGIRGDGGVRASILVLPEDESDDDFGEEADGEEGRDIEEEENLLEQGKEEESAANGVREAIRHSGLGEEIEDNTATSSSTDTDEHIHNVPHQEPYHQMVPPDPLLAAVGATSVRGSGVSESDQMSHTTRRRMSMDRSMYSRSNAGGDLEDLSSEELRAKQRFSIILSDSLWMVWSHWTTALIFGLLDILEDRLHQLIEDATEDDEDDVGLMQPDLSNVTLTLKPGDMASLGLSAGNNLDVELIESLGTYLLCLLVGADPHEDGARVTVNKGWAVFRWLL